MVTTLTVKDSITPELYRLAKKAESLKPVMARVEREILSPMVATAWSASGLQSRSGALERAVVAWHGDESAGITLRAPRGRRDKDLVRAKADTHTWGRRKWSTYRAVFSAGFRTSKKTGKQKWSNKIMASKTWKRVRSPWGDIPARKFFPEERLLAQKKPAIISMIKEFLQNA